MLHRIKIHPEFYQAVIEDRKPFEIRLNDRDYKVNDDVILNEYANGEYTGRFCAVTITEIFDVSFIMPGYVAFTFKKLADFTASFE